ncbi:heavy-metal-associated domain-containing protein [Ideonella sp.]|uniref:heavy-metal-associated domain-containing protein n=1 Tax=Ideonella sp. TaxID=1929293 RepID=UPI0035AF9C8F
MLTFEVKDMTCGHCVGAITQALQAADPAARVEIDLASHRVQVQPAAADATALAQAIADAGYTPVPVAAVDAPPAKAGGCGGGCRCG